MTDLEDFMTANYQTTDVENKKQSKIRSGTGPNSGGFTSIEVQKKFAIKKLKHIRKQKKIIAQEM